VLDLDARVEHTADVIRGACLPAAFCERKIVRHISYDLAWLVMLLVFRAPFDMGTPYCGIVKRNSQA
jgi:hypothetical protein